jgi:RNA polymerase sigma factor (sigma-70 family)
MGEMNDSEDITLLRDWARKRSETAFRAVVERYAGLVFGVALRRTGERALAEEAVQNVFTDLSRKAPVIVELQRPLAAWLHRSAVYEAATLLRSEIRHREKMKRYASSASDEPGRDPWQEVRPHLDAAINALGESDRRVLLLHWFDRRTFADIAERTGSTTAAVQRRGLRALDKLAALLRRRGAVIPVAVLAADLTPQLSHAAPAGLAATVSTAATHSAPVAGGVAGFLQQTLSVMTSAKLTTAAVALIAAAVPVSVQYAAASRAHTAHRLSESPEPAPASIAPSAPAKLDLTVVQQTLRRLIANADDYQTQLELRRFMFSLNANEIKPVLDLLMAVPGPQKRALYDVVHALFARWAELDPAAAAEAAFKIPKSEYGFSPLRGAFITWAHVDLDTAWSWLEKTTTDPFDREFLGGGALACIVDDSKKFAPVMARLDAMTDTAWRDKLRYWVARANTRPAVEWAMGLPEGDERVNWVPRTIELAGANEPEYALRLLGNIENSQRRAEVGHNVLWPWLLQRPVGGHRSPPDMIDTLENQVGTWSTGMFRDAGDALTRHDPATALATAKRLPEGESRDEFLQGMLIGVHYNEARAVLPALSMLSEEALIRHGGLGNFTEIFSKQDPRAAAEWISSLPDNSKVRTWADSAFKGTTGRTSDEFLTTSPK